MIALIFRESKSNRARLCLGGLALLGEVILVLEYLVILAQSSEVRFALPALC